jgi:V/A-type H+-transporting ATPase subunit I
MLKNLRERDFVSALFEQVTWLVLLNCLVLLGLSKAGMLPTELVPIFGWIAIIQAILIFLFTERNSGIGGRIGGGVFALFNVIFYFGDILSYSRLMALGMVTAGLGMAVNILVQLLMDIPYVGFILGAGLFVGGHFFNLAMSVLSSFVHSLRLQFVEFFPKFLQGGGKDFKPLEESYQYILINQTRNN